MQLAESICEKLKIIYFKDAPWACCYKELALKMRDLKCKARLILAHMNEIEMLKTLRTFGLDDLKEMMEHEETLRCAESLVKDEPIKES